jgi:hypothetical protein
MLGVRGFHRTSTSGSVGTRPSGSALEVRGKWDSRLFLNSNPVTPEFEERVEGTAAHNSGKIQRLIAAQDTLAQIAPGCLL